MTKGARGAPSVIRHSTFGILSSLVAHSSFLILRPPCPPRLCRYNPPAFTGTSRTEGAALMFNLLPKDTVFYDLFEEIARHIVSCAEHLRKLTRKFPDIAGEIQHIRDEEHQADELAHKALDRLDRKFITPFDREDIHTLIGERDDIVDNIDALAKRFPLFHVKAMEPDFAKQADVLVEAALAVSEAVHR